MQADKVWASREEVILWPDSYNLLAQPIPSNSTHSSIYPEEVSHGPHSDHA